jgi:hypothetical protein
MAKRVADLLVDVLPDAGVQRVYGVSGDWKGKPAASWTLPQTRTTWTLPRSRRVHW